MGRYFALPFNTYFPATAPISISCLKIIKLPHVISVRKIMFFNNYFDQFICFVVFTQCIYLLSL